MRWSEASLSPEEPLHLTEGGGVGGGRRGKDGELQAGMKVRKPSLSKEPKRRIKKKNKNKWGKGRSLLGLLHLDTAIVKDK